MRPILHWTVSARPGFDAVCLDPHAPWLWTRLPSVFPHGLAAVLMRDHFHALAPLDDRGRQRASLAAVLGHFSRTFGEGVRCWRPIADPTRITTHEKLCRDLRYIALNPCRRTRRHGPLCRDPLEWMWSTHRDVIGATVSPWVPADRVALALGDRRPDFRRRFHAYVSSDPSVDVSGTELPVSQAEGIVSRVPLARVAESVAAAMRLRAEELPRSPIGQVLLVHLARRHGWRSRDELAAALGCSVRTVSRRNAASVDERALTAAALCLGDPRLRRRP